jgi:hypothetical protein
MRILVYLDTPRQRSYLASVKTAVAGMRDASVFAGGPGVAEGYFALAEDPDLPLNAQVPRPSLATRIRLALRNMRRWRHTSYTGLLAATQPARRGVKAAVRTGLAGIKSALRPRVAALHQAWREARATSPVLQHFAHALHIAGLSWRGRAARALASARAIRPIRLVEKRHQQSIRKLPPPWRSIMLFWSRVTLAIAAVSTLALNSVSITRQLLQRRVYLQEAARLIERTRPQVIVMMEDNAEGLTGVMTSAARRAGIPFIILPDYIPNPVEPATYYRDSKAHQVRTLLDWLVATAYPKWTYAHNGRMMIRLPAPTILAYHLLRCDPPAPWILNAGYANAIALDSTAMWNHYLSLGFRQSKLRVIGTAQDDRLHARFTDRSVLRAELMQDLGLPADRPIVLCAFPPDQYASSDTNAFEYPTYANLVAAWFAELAAISDKANVIVRPHPRTAPGLLERDCPPGVHIVWTPTEDLIPICDLYVASVSTTIRWALGLGLPVLNYDCYRYGYGDFSSAQGVLECTDRDAFASALRDTIADTRELAAKASSDRHAWGQVDGKYAKRLRLLLLEAAASDGTRPRPTHSTTAVPGATLIRNALKQFRSQR